MGSKMEELLATKSIFFAVIFILQYILTIESASSISARKPLANNSSGPVLYPPVQLYMHDDHVVVDNGIFSITIASPQGTVTGIEFNGIDNILNDHNGESDRGYWDVNWSDPKNPTDKLDKLIGEHFDVITNYENQVELSFKRYWKISQNGNRVSLNVDKRYVVLRGSSGFYSYGILERFKGWPDVDVYQGRIVFKLQDKLFRYMAVSDERQREMPSFEDRSRGEPLDYPEAVLLTHPSDSLLRGEVDDKYQYSTENKDNRVHGWICSDPPVGFWMITPSNEFRNGGPVKQDLTSHAGPVTLSMFFSTHYAGTDLGMEFRDGEPWKKVFGPVFIYLNSVASAESPTWLWADAKEEMLMQTDRWPYDFLNSSDFPRAHQRGVVSGRLFVRDVALARADSAFIGLAPPGTIGSWQVESKGYQFWTRTDNQGYFEIKNVRPGQYNLYAWVPGYIGDYMHPSIVNVLQGSRIRMGVLVFHPPRNGPTIWEIGVPDRTAAEFYVPEPNPTLMNQLYTSQRTESFRQYGLWDRYTDLYPEQDLVYRVGVSNYETDWFFAHVTRKVGNKTYIPTTWTILFDLENIEPTGNYTIQLALASATAAELHVRINDPRGVFPFFTTGLIGKDNAIARHGIHGLYWLYNINVLHTQLRAGRNVMYLTQTRALGPFRGVMYDYIRLERPPRS
ncbi:rhamnogalacturonate lyase family protein [Artemisia annua]|uniref:rhamnogalacturonan endolyase n=1 Tax=Artemisia annua TaxID=35608 RepID=A0A2U1PQM1_ARTAN|nr:rhamnogalacturonate lyase family protein [Artemisia annua]